MRQIVLEIRGANPKPGNDHAITVSMYIEQLEMEPTIVDIFITCREALSQRGYRTKLAFVSEKRQEL